MNNLLKHHSENTLAGSVIWTRSTAERRRTKPLGQHAPQTRPDPFRPDGRRLRLAGDQLCAGTESARQARWRLRRLRATRTFVDPLRARRSSSPRSADEKAQSIRSARRQNQDARRARSPNIKAPTASFLARGEVSGAGAGVAARSNRSRSRPGRGWRSGRRRRRRRSSIAGGGAGAGGSWDFEQTKRGLGIGHEAALPAPGS